MKPSTACPAVPPPAIDNLTTANSTNTLTVGDGDATGLTSPA